jgi:D-aspartate ligase
MSAPPAVVFGLLHAGLALVRGLGRAGVPVTGVAWRENEFGLSSRYVRERVLLGADGAQGPGDALLDALRRIAGDGRVVLFPERDENVELVLDRWEEVREVADLPLPDDPEVVRRLRRKELLPLEAERAGVPAPATVLAADEEAIRGADLRAPFLVKPAEGQEFAAAFGEKAMVVRSLDEAVAAWRRARDHGFDTIVQELVPDATDRIYSLFTYIGRSGEPLGSVVGRKVRQSPIEFGSSAVFEVDYVPEVEELGQRLLRSAGYRGFAHVEMAHDLRDGTFKLIEVNTRTPIWGGLVMTRSFDLAQLAYRDLAGEKVVPLGTFKEDVRWIFLAKDVWVSLQLARQRRLGVREFAAPYVRGRKVRASFAADDLRGAVASLGYLRSRL